MAKVRSVRNLGRLNTVEQLEKRTLLSVALDETGVLQLAGTAASDQFIVTSSGTTLQVEEVGAKSYVFELASISGIVARMGKSHDRLEATPSLNIPIKFRGGAGSDTVIGGAGADTLVGGRGKDLLIGNEGRSLVYGSKGRDRLISGADADTIYGGAAADIINSGTGEDVIIDDQGVNQIDTGEALILQPLSTARYEPQAFLPSVAGYDPNQIRHAYNFPGFDDPNAVRGQGQTIYIVDAFTGRDVAGDFAVFCKTFDLPAPTTENFQIINAGGRTPAVDAGWAGEINLDVQWARAIAPEARIVLVQADSSLGYDILRALRIAASMSEADGGGVVSLSLGFPVNDALPPDSAAWDAIFSTSTNTTFLVAAGDDPGILSYPAFSPYVTAVGGTILRVNQDGQRNGEEIAWFEDLDPTSIFDAPVGTGGGVTANYPRPGYQDGVHVPGPFGDQLLGGRGVPDVAFNASVFNGVATYITTPQDRDTGWFSVGGTSAGAPQWAGLVALMNQRRQQANPAAATIGNELNGILYEMYANGELDGSNTALVDILSGDVATQVDADAIYPIAGSPGYDLATGLGVPNASLLIERAVSANSYYFQQNFSYDAQMYVPLIQSTAYSSLPLASRPRSGTGLISGGDIVLLDFQTVLNDWYSDPTGLAAGDDYSDISDPFARPPIELYRTRDGRIYGDGYASIATVDPGITIFSYEFKLQFEGTWSVGADGETHFEIDFFAIDPLTGQKLRKPTEVQQSLTVPIMFTPWGLMVSLPGPTSKAPSAVDLRQGSSVTIASFWSAK